MPPGGNTTLLVGVQSITYRPDPDVETNAYSFTFSDNTGFYAAIDSTLPYLQLPENICDQFADKFQLTYDSKRAIYTINSTAHSHNTQQNATVNFKIGSSNTNSNDYATITLPYSAFDLQANYPIFDNATNYFPIKKSPNGVLVLGRAFLQEAYIIVDYEHHNFTVAQAIPASSTADVRPILSSSYVNPANTNPATPIRGGSKGLSGGAIAGIVVGILAVVGFLAVGAFFLWKRRREQKRKTELPAEKTSGDIDTVTAGDQVKHRRVSELDSEGAASPKASMGGYYDNKDATPFPPINEMESPPAELYSPPPESLNGLSVGTPGSGNERNDYFIAGGKMRRRGATRESSGNNTPGTPNVLPIAELPGDDGKFTVDGQHFEPVASPPVSPAQSPAHSRDASDTSLPSNIDEVISGAKRHSQQQLETQPEEGEEHSEHPIEQRPSHLRGPSDTTVNSDTTAVSQPTPEELENWALGSDESRRISHLKDSS